VQSSMLDITNHVCVEQISGGSQLFAGENIDIG
jgi:hypothetical protein